MPSVAQPPTHTVRFRDGVLDARTNTFDASAPHAGPHFEVDYAEAKDAATPAWDRFTKAQFGLQGAVLFEAFVGGLLAGQLNVRIRGDVTIVDILRAMFERPLNVREMPDGSLLVRSVRDEQMKDVSFTRVRSTAELQAAILATELPAVALQAVQTFHTIDKACLTWDLPHHDPTTCHLADFLLDPSHVVRDDADLRLSDLRKAFKDVAKLPWPLQASDVIMGLGFDLGRPNTCRTCGASPSTKAQCSDHYKPDKRQRQRVIIGLAFR